MYIKWKYLYYKKGETYGSRVYNFKKSFVYYYYFLCYHLSKLLIVKQKRKIDLQVKNSLYKTNVIFKSYKIIAKQAEIKRKIKKLTLNVNQNLFSVTKYEKIFF